jgi:uncharacterized membrane protein
MAVANLGDKIIARPNNSLSVDDSVKLLAALAGIALVVALGFLHIGAWLVLPFAGLEIMAFAYAFHTVYLHADDFESITIENDRVVVEKRNVKEITTTVFQRYWAQVNVRDVAMIKVRTAMKWNLLEILSTMSSVANWRGTSDKN